MKVAILITSWNGKSYLQSCLDSLAMTDFPKANYQIVLVDNGSTDDTIEYVRSSYPEVMVIALPENFGFAGGNNAGLRQVVQDGYDYVVLLNQDTIVEPAWLNPLVRAVENDPTIGAAQSLILKYGMNQTVNSSGNLMHILGFGYCGDLGKPVASLDLALMREVVDISYPMGACVLLRISALRIVGLFDELFFAYAEDLDLAWRLRIAGYRNVMVPTSVVYHHYAYKRHPQKSYWIERNRWLSMLKNYHLGTLFLLAPALLAFELYMHVYAIFAGWWGLKFKSMCEVISHLPEVCRSRRKIQRLRRIPERIVISSLTPVLRFEEQQGLLVDFGNYLLEKYWHVVQRIVFW